MATTPFDEGYKVKEAVRALIRSRELKPLLERFHQKLEAMDSGVSIQGGKVILAAGTKTDVDTAAELLAGHLFRELTFESVFDPELMQTAANLGKALNALRGELFGSTEFLSMFTDMLKASRNCDDLGLLASLCLNLYSGSGSNPRLAGMSEVSNPELVIEMSKSFAVLMLSTRAGGIPPEPSASASALFGRPQDAQDKNAAEPPEAPAGETAKPAPAAPEPRTEATAPRAAKDPKPVTPKPPDERESATPKPAPTRPAHKLKGLAARLVEMGLSERLAVAYVKGCTDESASMKRLDEYAGKWGADITIMAVCRNRGALNENDTVGRLLYQYSARAAKFRKNEQSRKKYVEVEKALAARPGLSPEQVLVVVDALAYRLAEPVQVISNLDMLLESVPEDAVKMMLLGNPQLLCKRNDVSYAIRTCPPEMRRTQNGTSVEEGVKPAPSPQIVAKPAESLKALADKMAEIGASRELVDDILKSPRYSEQPEQCLRNLQAFMDAHGRTFTLLALYRNRALLLGTIGHRALSNLKSEVKQVRDDPALLEKYRDIVTLIVAELNVPEEAVYPMIVTLKKGIRPEMAAENVKLLFERVPKARLREIALASPSKLALIRDIAIILADYPAPGKEVDGRKLADDIVKKLEGKRPEAFIRAYVEANLQTLASRTLENAAVKVEFAARNLQMRGTVAGIPNDSVRECIEKGMIDFEEIKSFHEDAEALRDITPEKAIPLLEAKMVALGADQELVKELLASQMYRDRADRCLLNLNTLVRKHGPGIALVMLYKNRMALLGQNRDSVLMEIRGGLRKVSKGSPTLAKYQNIKNTLVAELALPEEAALLVLAKIKKGCEDRIMEDLKLLIARVDREKLRAILLRSPHMLSSKTNLEAILSSAPPAEVVDEEELLRLVLEEGQGRRPEAFARAVVLSNSGSFVFQTPARVWTYVEYKARILLGMGTTHGVPQEFILAAMEKGMTDFAAIKKEFASSGPAAIPPATAGTERAAAQAPPAAPPALPQAEVESQTHAEGAAPATVCSGSVNASWSKIGEPLIEEPIVAPSEAATVAATPVTAPAGSTDQDGIIAVLSKYGINGDIRKDVLARFTGNPGCDALSRMTSAISLFEQCAEPGQSINVFVRDFFVRRATRDALFNPAGRAFDDITIEAAENLTSEAARPSSPPPTRNGGGKNGLKHINIPAGDIPIFEKIRSFPIPEDVQMYLESRHLDAHEFSYVVLKMLRWITNRVPQPQSEEVRNGNAAKIAGDAAAEVLKVITPMMKEARHGNSTYYEVRSESEMDEASLAVFRVLKQVKFSIG